MKRTTLFVLLLCLCTAAFAQDNPLSKPVWEVGPWFGGGTGLGHASDFKFINAGVRIGRVLTGTIGDGKFRGTFEWASDIMPVYEVRPGIIATDMTVGVKQAYDARIAGGLVPEGRWGTPEEVGRAVAALLRGDVSYATGTVIHVDGGLSIPRL